MLPTHASPSCMHLVCSAHSSLGLACEDPFAAAWPAGFFSRLFCSAWWRRVRDIAFVAATNPTRCVPILSVALVLYIVCTCVRLTPAVRPSTAQLRMLSSQLKWNRWLPGSATCSASYKWTCLRTARQRECVGTNSVGVLVISVSGARFSARQSTVLYTASISLLFARPLLPPLLLLHPAHLPGTVACHLATSGSG